MSRRSRPSLPALHFFFMGANHEQVENYENWRKDRVKSLTRKTFFDVASWAILVAFQSSKNASEWRRKAKSTGFPFKWTELGKWNDKDFDKWCKVMAQELANPRRDLEKKFRDRWWNIWDLAYQLTFFENEKDFRQQFFQGKRRGDELTFDDVDYLIKKKKKEKILGGIGEISIPFILSNLGGDFLKDDVWIQALREWYNDISLEELNIQLENNDVHKGEFDAACWEYCNREIAESKYLEDHLNEMFGTR